MTWSSLADLKAIAQARKVPYGGAALKEDLVAWLNWALGQPGAVHAAVADCSKAERDALATLVAAGGLLPAHVFTARFGSVRRAQAAIPAGAPGRGMWPRAGLAFGAVASPAGASATEGLWFKGLIFRAGGLGVPPYSESIFIPGDLLPLMPTAEPLPPLSVEAAAAPLQVVGGDGLSRDLLTFLIFLKRESVTPVRGSALSKRHLVSLASQLSWREDVSAVQVEEESGYPFFLHCLLSALKLVSAHDRRLAPTPKVGAWLSQTPYQQFSDAWVRYLRLTSWNELSRLGLVHLASAERLLEARRCLAGTLAHCSAGQWLSMASFVRKVHEEHPYMLRPQADQRTWPVRDESGKALGDWEAWERVEGGFIRATLAGSLTWFGVVDRDSEVSAFRVTSLGAAILATAPSWPEEPAPRPFVVHANFEVLVPLEARLADVYRLEDFAEIVKRDRASLYSITKESVRRSMENGDRGDAMSGFLEAASGRELPQNVAYSLREWAGKYGEIEIKRGTILTTANQAIMQELRGSRKLKLPAHDELGPQAVSIAEDGVGELIARLKKAGYSPRLGDGVEGQREASAAGGERLANHELVPLLAAARLAEGSGLAGRFPAGLLDRVERLLGADDQSAVRRLLAEMQEAKEGSERSRSGPAQPSVRLATTFTVPELERAIQRRERVDLEYYDDAGGEIVRRRVDPYRLESSGGVVRLVGYCHLRQEEQSFLVHHIRSVAPTDLPFEEVARGL